MPANYGVSHDAEGEDMGAGKVNNSDVGITNTGVLNYKIPSLIATYGRNRNIILGIILESIGEVGSTFCENNGI